MAITQEQADKIKEELYKQLDNLPQEKREDVKKQIDSMTNEQLEELLKQNQQEGDSEADKCIFCSIVSGKTQSIKIDENEEAVAVIDINPISKGHTLVIQKEHNKEPTEKSQELAFSVGKRILEKLKPKDITTRASKTQGHSILNVIPIYEDTDFEKRKKESEKELMETAKKISAFDIEKKEKPKTQEKDVTKDTQCPICNISKGHTKTMKIDENKENTAILDTRPISKGHSLIIPKRHDSITSMPQTSFSLAKKVAKRIKQKYKANDIKINPTSNSNHAFIELIPLYNDTDPSKRQETTDEELKKTQKDLSPVKREKKTTKKTSPFKRNYPHLPQLPPRIP